MSAVTWGAATLGAVTWGAAADRAMAREVKRQRAIAFARKMRQHPIPGTTGAGKAMQQNNALHGRIV